MDEKEGIVNRVNNGWRCNEELRRELQDIEDSADDGPVSGLGLREPFLSSFRTACLDYAARRGNEEAICDGARSWGVCLKGAQLAGGAITDREISEQATSFAAEIGDRASVEDGDAFDIAHAAFHDGIGDPRTDLSEIAARQKQERDEAAKAVRKSGRDTFSEMEAAVTAAIERTCNDPGAIFEPHILSRLGELRNRAPDKYQRLRVKIKELGSDVLKEFERALRQQECERRDNNKELGIAELQGKAVRAAKGGSAVEAANEEETNSVPLDSRSAYEYGTSPNFESSNEYMCAELLRLLNRQYAVVSYGGDLRILEEAHG